MYQHILDNAPPLCFFPSSFVLYLELSYHDPHRAFERETNWSTIALILAVISYLKALFSAHCYDELTLQNFNFTNH